MADNLETPFGKVATRDEAGVHFQRTIIQALLSGGGGARADLIATALNGLLVDVTRVSGTVIVTPARVPLTASAPNKATVGVASGAIIAGNGNRKGLVLVNTSANWVYLGFGVAAVLGSGIALSPNGGSYVMGEFDFSTAAINGISSAAGSNVSIQEFI